MKLQRSLEESGRRELEVAPTMSAVEELQKVGFSDAITVERLLQGRSAQTDLFRKALIVDEAGMVSGRQMSEHRSLPTSSQCESFSAVTPSRFEASRPPMLCGCWKQSLTWKVFREAGRDRASERLGTENR